jgi:uncharacterized protein
MEVSMSEDANEITPVASSERLEVLDVLRGLAVGGILIGNMQWFSGYGMMPPELASGAPIHDQITTFLVHFFIEGKFYSIFSFLFGFGFAMQIARAAERGDTNASLFKRRLVWLLVIGLLHAYLVWAGDILSIYALMGFVLLLFRKKSERSLIKWAGIMIVIPIFTALLLYILFVSFVSPETLAQLAAGQLDNWRQMVTTVQQGTYYRLMTDFNLDYIAGRYAGLIIQMRLPKILAMFLFGLYAYRKGVFQNPSAHGPFIRRVMVYGLALGVIGNLMMAALAGNESPFPPSLSGWFGVIGYAFGVPALALGIAALVLTLWQSTAWKKVLEVFAPVGRMALTNYLMQSIVCVTIFYGYGFGLFGTVGALKATSIALVIFAAQIVLSSVWLSYFRYGPMEWIWRQLTYRRRMELRRTAA